jgi:cell division protein FtsL
MAGTGTISARHSRLSPWLPWFDFRNPEIAATGTLIAIMVAILLLGGGLFYVWHRMQLVQIGYEISSLEEKNRDLKKRKRELMLEIASLQSPAELEKKALQNGLIVPSRDKVVHVP